MADPKVDMQRGVGKFAILLAFCSVLVVFGVVVSTAGGNPIPWYGWPLLLIPAIAYVPAVVDAIRLHRTADPEQTGTLWWRSLLLALVGLALTVASVIGVERITPV